MIVKVEIVIDINTGNLFFIDENNIVLGKEDGLFEPDIIRTGIIKEFDIYTKEFVGGKYEREM